MAQISSKGTKTNVSQREKEERFLCRVASAPYMLRSSAFLSGRAEFYLFENVVVVLFFFLSLFFLFLILACPQNMGREIVCLEQPTVWPGSLGWRGAISQQAEKYPRAPRVLWALGGRLTQPRGGVPGC